MTDESQVVLLTGGTSGIGRAAARKLAARGATVAVTGRRTAAGEAVREEIRTAHPSGAGAFYRADFADLDDVRRLARDVERDFDRLDVLVNNAGTVQSERTLTDAGVELTVAVNYLAPFVLTTALLPLLRDSAPARVVNTLTLARDDSFDAMADGDLSDLEAVAAGENFRPEQAYVDSKLALCLFTYELAARLGGTGVRASGFNPGWIPQTGIARDAPLSHRLVFAVAGRVARVAPVGKLESTAGGAETLVHHALERDLPDGEGSFFEKRERADPGPRARDEALRARLWNDTEALLADADAEAADRSRTAGSDGLT